jgi:hypothetical protein
MFTVLAQGIWRPGSVRTTWVESRRPLIDEVERAIDAAWDRAGARPGVHLFDGPMCRLESFGSSTDELRLVLSPTSYKPFLGTNLSNPHFADRFGASALANSVGCSVALTTRDGWLLLGMRGDRVAYHPERVHPFAGSLEPADATTDVFHVVPRELGEELNLSPSHIADVACLGLIADDEIRQPELVFTATTDLTRATLESQLDRMEHDAIWPVRTDAASIASATADPILTPVAVGTLKLWRDTRMA